MTRLVALLPLLLLTACSIPPASDSPPERRGGTVTTPARALGLPGHLPPRSVEDDGSGELSPFETGNDEISRLDPDLLAAVQEAAREAKQDHIPFWVTSGWRSRAHQQRLLDDAVARYGSLAQALRWVSTPDTSAHVQGHAVDIGPGAADAWLEHNGARWGLCRAFGNERWHFELRAQPGGTCPSLYPDSSYRQ
ncbi:MAG: M15 family metallopeptidase [Marmoricola sp.]